MYWRRCFLLRSVTRPDPSTRMTYWSYCRTSTTIPVRSHLVGCGPTRFCSLTQLPIMSGGKTRVCSDSRSCALMCRIRSASSLACSFSRHVQWGRYCPGGTGMKSRMQRPNMISASTSDLACFCRLTWPVGMRRSSGNRLGPCCQPASA